MKRIQLTLITILISFHVLSAQESSTISIEETQNQPTDIQVEKASQHRMPQKKSWWTKTKIIGASIVGTAATILGIYASYRLAFSKKNPPPPPGQQPHVPANPQPIVSAASQPARITAQPARPTVPSRHAAASTEEDPVLAVHHNQYDQLLQIYERERNLFPQLEASRGKWLLDTIYPILQVDYPAVFQLITANITITRSMQDYDTVINGINTIIDSENDATLKNNYYLSWIHFYIHLFSTASLTATESQTIRTIQMETHSERYQQH